MKKLKLLGLAVCLLTFSEAYAGSGDLIVDGKVGVGIDDPGDFRMFINGNTKLGMNMTIGRSGSHNDEIGYNIGFTSTNDSYSYLINDYAASIRMGNAGDIEFRTAPNGVASSALNLQNVMTVKQNGNVGIGAADPASLLAGTSGLVVYNANYPGIGIANSTNRWLWYMVGDNLKLWEPNNDRVVIKKGGNVGIGTPDPVCKLDVAGYVQATNVTYPSDINFKKNLLPIVTSLDKVLRLTGISYEWKTDVYRDKGFPEGRHYGVIAQEIEKVLPEVVNTAPDGSKAVAYTEIIPVLIEAIKEQQGEIELLKKRLEKVQQ